MKAFGLPPSRLIGELKRALEAAVEAGEIAPHLESEAYVQFLGENKSAVWLPSSPADGRLFYQSPKLLANRSFRASGRAARE